MQNRSLMSIILFHLNLLNLLSLINNSNMLQKRMLHRKTLSNNQTLPSSKIKLFNKIIMEKLHLMFKTQSLSKTLINLSYQKHQSSDGFMNSKMIKKIKKTIMVWTKSIMIKFHNIEIMRAMNSITFMMKHMRTERNLISCPTWTRVLKRWARMMRNGVRYISR